MKQYFDLLLREHLEQFRQMFFLADPRQVGKTTCAKHLEESASRFHYFNWDWIPHRQLLMDMKKLEAELSEAELIEVGDEIIVFDEVHKMPIW